MTAPSATEMRLYTSQEDLSLLGQEVESLPSPASETDTIR